jgi:signal transduction histidine kinase
MALEGLRAVVDRLPEAVVVVDPNGVIQLMNTAAIRLFAERPLRDDVDLLSRFDGVGPTASKRSVRGDPPRRATVRPRHQPNTWFSLDRVPFDEAVTPGVARQDGEPIGSVFVLRDITDSADLEAEREAFLAVLSHELRTPLTTIYAGASVLARRPRLPSPATETLARDISAEAARLYDLVENLLVIARLERRILEPVDEPVDLARSVDAAIRTITERYADIPIVRSGGDSAPAVHGDATYVEQACRNLLLVAWRFASAADDPQLVVRIDPDGANGEVAVRVFDRGPSMSQDELGRAFDLPAENPTGRLDGSGMGPFVARHVIGAMNGRTWARNRDGGGLEMGFALPIHDGPAKRPDAAPSAGSSAMRGLPAAL